MPGSGVPGVTTVSLAALDAVGGGRHRRHRQLHLQLLAHALLRQELASSQREQVVQP